MIPAARIAAAIDLLAAIEADRARPADAIANDWFRGRRFIGSGDRRTVSDCVWHVLRHYRRLGWWLGRVRAASGEGTPPPLAGLGREADEGRGERPEQAAMDIVLTFPPPPFPQKPGESDFRSHSPRLLVAASLLLQATPLSAIATLFSGGRFAPAPLDAAEQAVLRPLEGHTIDHPAMPDAVRLEVPDWLYPRLAVRFGTATRAELAALLLPAPLDLRVNLLKTTSAEAQAALAAEGLRTTPTRFSPWGLRLDGRRQITAGAAFRSGLVEIQDEGSQLVAILTDAHPGQRVCDYCAGAGGKTLALAAAMQNRGHLLACDTAAARLDNAARRLRRAGVGNVERHLLEPGDKWAKRRAGSFDRVLVDAPCTGTGTWRRNPDARQRLSESDLAELLDRQAAILDAAAALVRTRGHLVYATCSLLDAENEAQVTRFLARHPGFSLVPLAHAWPLQGPPPCEGEFLSLTPARHGTDGFFAAVLERTA
ncbi:MAG TPA: RsmB/NOP family class I SAM-dependent RNA methyltransferase [Acetobacteraceae bacterium]|nr:RsmB/NOP family class I SAM-dependent RNA methyltransferase [Acetobacteraceae bacterium]